MAMNVKASRVKTMVHAGRKSEDTNVTVRQDSMARTVK